MSSHVRKKISFGGTGKCLKVTAFLLVSSLSLCVCGVYSLLSVLSNFPFTAFFALNNPCIGTATAFCNHAVVIALLKPLTRFKLNLQLKCQHQMVKVSSNLNKQLLCPPRLRSGRHAPDVSVVLDDVSRRNPVHKFHN